MVDNGQALHFRQLFQVLELLGFDRTGCEHVPFGLVLVKSGEGGWEKGKTRAGHASLLKDVVEAAQEKILAIMAEKNPDLPPSDAKGIARQIAVGALVFAELKNRRLNDIRFEWNLALSFEGDSGPYVQNAHVRLSSILRKAETGGEPPPGGLEGMRWGELTEPASMALVELLSEYPDRVAAALSARDPCTLTQFSLSLADASHRFLHACRVLGSEQERERLLLVRAVRMVLASALDLIGVPPIETM